MADGVVIEDFIKQAMAEIENGLGPNHVLDGTVDFELSVAVSTAGKAGFNLKVLGVGGEAGVERDDEIIHTVGFSVRSVDDLDHQIEQQVKTIVKGWLDQNSQKLLSDLNKKPLPTPSDERIKQAILAKRSDIDPAELPFLVKIIKEELAADRGQKQQSKPKHL